MMHFDNVRMLCVRCGSVNSISLRPQRFSAFSALKATLKN